MPKGRKKTSHKGGHRKFTNEEQLAVVNEKIRREREWRKQHGLLDSDEEEEEEEAQRKATALKTGGGAAAAAEAEASGPVKSYGESYGKEESEESSSEEEVEEKPKGVEHLIEIENPNRVQQKTKKVHELDAPGAPAKTELSRREREEIEKQQSKERYMKMHMAGKTDEARADLARLALIRKQREEAAKKRDEEKLAREAKEAAQAKKK